MKITNISHKIRRDWYANDRNDYYGVTTQSLMTLQVPEGNKQLEYLAKHKDFHQDVVVPDWVDYFLGIAEKVSERSKDAQTKCGTILTDPYHHPLSTGYNSFVRDLPDDVLANLRPLKYSWFRHSEQSALDNKTTNFWLYPQGVTAYITGKPCFQCIQALWANNVKTVYYSNFSKPKMTENEDDDFNFFVSVVPIRIYYVERT